MANESPETLTPPAALPGVTAVQMHLVRESFDMVRPSADQTAALFYARLFEIAPETRALFPEDIAAQGAKLMATLELAVASLDAPARLIPALEDLGRRHTGYSVRDAHYDTVAEVLLWTLQQTLGPAFTPEVRAAWTAVYAALARVMKEAAAAE